jgi:hypothetical protein
LEGEANFTYNGSQTRISRNDTATGSGLFVTQAGTGDASLQVSAGAGNYSIGVDNSATSDPLKISAADNLGTADIMQFLSSGIVSFVDINFNDVNSISGLVNINMTGNIEGNGTANLFNFDQITANSKSFDIEHPTKKLPWRIEYGVLEGPEHGVFFRGLTTENVIELPDYWLDLVHEDSYTVHLTPIGGPCVHWVEKVENNKVYINCQDGKPNCYFTINATRKDVNPPKLEYIKK